MNISNPGGQQVFQPLLTIMLHHDAFKAALFLAGYGLQNCQQTRQSFHTTVTDDKADLRLFQLRIFSRAAESDWKVAKCPVVEHTSTARHPVCYVKIRPVIPITIDSYALAGIYQPLPPVSYSGPRIYPRARFCWTHGRQDDTGLIIDQHSIVRPDPINLFTICIHRSASTYKDAP